MSDRPIAFLDSGLGGVPYLLATRALLPREGLVYYADTRNFPYGDRAEADVRRIVREAVARLIELSGPRLIVIACNTASVVGLDDLRRRFNVPFVGVVPAIKPAAERASSGRIGVLATSRTVEGPYLASLIHRFTARDQVELVAADSLVQMIEHRLGEPDEDPLREALRPSIVRLCTAGVRTIVLGCTHFIHVRRLIEELAGPGVAVVDSVDGVVRQVMRLAGDPRVEDGGAPDEAALDEAKAPPLMLVSGPAGASYRFVASAHQMLLQADSPVVGMSGEQR